MPGFVQVQVVLGRLKAGLMLRWPATGLETVHWLMVLLRPVFKFQLLVLVSWATYHYDE